MVGQGLAQFLRQAGIRSLPQAQVGVLLHGDRAPFGDDDELMLQGHVGGQVLAARAAPHAQRLLVVPFGGGQVVGRSGQPGGRDFGAELAEIAVGGSDVEQVAAVAGVQDRAERLAEPVGVGARVGGGGGGRVVPEQVQ